MLAASNIGRGMRAVRERRGWARETLAHHAGVSLAAIAQIEAGRRPDPRLSTVMALAEALDVTLDQLAGVPSPNSRSTHPLEHRALPYATDEDFVNAIVPFLTAGLARSEAVLVVTAPSRSRRLRRALGRDAARVQFRQSSSWYTSPVAAMDGFRAFVQERTDAGCAWVRAVGEPVWTGRSPKEIRAWTRYESMINIALAGSSATIVCPYATHSLPASIVAGARSTHPETMSGATIAACPDYRSPERFLLEH